MTIDDITAFISSLGDVLVLRPGPGDGSPEISWGDLFFYYSPTGVVATNTQPFATIVTKDYPGYDEASRLDRRGVFRLNVAAGKEAFLAATGRAPRDRDAVENPGEDPGEDPGALDAVIAHPVYGNLGWLAVINPGPRTETVVRDLLSTAHDLARTRSDRRS